MCGIAGIVGPDAAWFESALARDPLGIKPLYVSHAGGRLFFASEVRALLATGQLSDALDQSSMDGLKAHPQFNEKAVSASWNHFLAAPESPMWSRVWLPVALGWYLRRLSAVSLVCE